MLGVILPFARQPGRGLLLPMECGWHVLHFVCGACSTAGMAVSVSTLPAGHAGGTLPAGHATHVMGQGLACQLRTHF